MYAVINVNKIVKIARGKQKKSIKKGKDIAAVLHNSPIALIKGLKSIPKQAVHNTINRRQNNTSNSGNNTKNKFE